MIHPPFDNSFPAFEYSALNHDHLSFLNILTDFHLIVFCEKFKILHLMQIRDKFIFCIIRIQTDLRNTSGSPCQTHGIQIKSRKNISGKHRAQYRRTLISILLSIFSGERVDINPVITRQIARDAIHLQKRFSVLLGFRHGTNQIPGQIRNFLQIFIF